jgi:hypothetical protein
LEGTGLASLSTTHLGVSLVQSVAAGVVLGTTLRFVRGRAAFERVDEVAGTAPDILLDRAATLEGAAENAVDLDAGVMGGWGGLRLGLVARNLRRPVFTAATPMGPVEVRMRRQVRAGFSLTPGAAGGVIASVRDPFTVAVDVDLTRTPTALGDRRNVAAGVERWLGRRHVGLRGGVRVNTIGASRPVLSAGGSVAVRSGLLLDAEVSRGRQAGDRSWGVAGRVTF